MRITGPIGSLSEIGGGTLAGGTVLYPTFLKNMDAVRGAGAAYTLGTTELVAGSSKTVQAGDIVAVHAGVLGTQSVATADLTFTIQKKSGTATGAFDNTSTAINTYWNAIAAGKNQGGTLIGFFVVTGAGTLVMQSLIGVSAGTFTVAANQAWMRCYVYRAS